MEEFYKIEEVDPPRRRDNRYRNCIKLQDVDTGEFLLSTREIYDIAVTPMDTYHRVKSNEVDRLDLIAAHYYRNPLLWWVIAQANDIYNPFQSLSPGDLLRIPPIETLYGDAGILL